MPRTLVAAALLDGGGNLCLPCAGVCRSETRCGLAHSLGHPGIQGLGKGPGPALMPLRDLACTRPTDPTASRPKLEPLSSAHRSQLQPRSRQGFRLSVRWNCCLLPQAPGGWKRSAYYSPRSLCKALVLGEGPAGSQEGRHLLAERAAVRHQAWASFGAQELKGGTQLAVQGPPE